MGSDITRRKMGRLMTAGTMASSMAPVALAQSGPRITVVGAGAFGGWTALHLLRRGARVTLLDSWGPGNSRASSGGETRITRAAYVDKVYADLTVRSLELWKENEAKWKRKIFIPCGVIRLQVTGNDESRKFLKVLRDAGVKHAELSVKDAALRFPQFRFDGIDWVLHEPEHGMLRARRGCEAVMESFVSEGGTFEQQMVRPGDRVEGDAVIWACGPWLGKLFPGTAPIRPIRQEIFFFGTPPGDPMYQETVMPCWIDDSAGTDIGRGHHFYGTPGNDWRGFKIGNEDEAAKEFDPDNGERRVTDGELASVRAYLKTRFPKLGAAPLVETRVCQYEVSPDRHLILDRHPTEPKYWIAGGGSGHGYKLGAAVGERMAEMVLGKRAIDPFFSLKRFKA